MKNREKGKRGRLAYCGIVCVDTIPNPGKLGSVSFCVRTVRNNHTLSSCYWAISLREASITSNFTDTLVSIQKPVINRRVLVLQPLTCGIKCRLDPNAADNLTRDIRSRLWVRSSARISDIPTATEWQTNRSALSSPRG